MDDKSDTLETYMFRFSERALMGHRVIRIDSPENFVADLYKTGLITNIIPTTQVN